MFTIEPLPASRMAGIAYLHAQTDPIARRVRMLANVSLSVSST